MSGQDHKHHGDLLTGRAASLYSRRAFLNGLRGIHRRAVALINLHSGERLIDIGCGNGVVLGLIHEKAPQAELLGIDGSNDMLEKARAYSSSQIAYKRAYASDLPSTDNYYDAAITVLAAHHMPPPEKRGMIGEAYRVLKPGGRFLVVDFGYPRTFFGRLIALLMRRHSYSKGNIEIIEEELKKKGFKIASRSWYWGYIEFILAKKP